MKHNILHVGKIAVISSILLGCMGLVLFKDSVDAAITNTVLPTISAQLGSTPADVIWVITSYQLVMVAAMLPLAALGEVIGHRCVFVGGLLLFTVTSLFCGLAGSLPTLVAARAVQGLGAAAIMGANTALVRLIYPPQRLGRGLGINALVIALALAGGPVVASAVLSVATWHWLFYLNLPIGVFATLLAWKLPVRQSVVDHSFNRVAALLCAGMFGMLIYGMGEVAHGFLNLRVVSEFLLALIFGLLLVRRERNRSVPIFPVDLFRNTAFLMSSAAAVCAYTTQGLALVALPFVFQSILGRSQIEIGFLIAPWPITGGLMAPIAGSLSDRLPAGVLGGVGLCCLGSSLTALAMLSTETSTTILIFCMMLCGFGFGLFLSPNQRTLMSSAPAGRSGSASGVLGTARLLGQSTGAALVALNLSLSPLHGAASALWTGAAFALAGGALSVLPLLPIRDRMR